MLHLGVLADAPAQGVQERRVVVGVDQIGQRHGQRKGLRCASDDPAETGTDVDDPGRVAHFQQDHPAAHMLQQGTEGDGIDRAELPALAVLIAAAALQAELVLAGLFGLVEGQISGLVQTVNLSVILCNN